ncbi:MAG TPA: shikimate kinase [Bacteroidales bacterium]|nr:MAG: hypothetical protein A2X11_08440 [Bacteroidetes bacterium GWE2_42_24]OFY30950.1 MAG: hypothetical protein A2X09_17215 [Bacteroidetes bacterium GWF2_43_11]PKP16904.1 MAG: shikimate kinase [Bacteroidetes bacterium HGW-Bacteroidetes-22]HBZ66450.1 shikimate kinase [Bacteroidales bacterium]
MRIYLVGFMGCGKSFSGRNLSRKLGFGFSDLDVLFENRYRVNIQEFFRKYGEATFRVVEQQILYETESFHKVVISTGGGTPCYADNMDWMNQHGISIYLKMSPSSLYHRLSHSRKPRPLIKDYEPEALRQFIRERLAIREPYYNKASLIVPGENLNLNQLTETLTGIIEPSTFPE